MKWFLSSQTLEDVGVPQCPTGHFENQRPWTITSSTALPVPFKTGPYPITC